MCIVGGGGAKTRNIVFLNMFKRIKKNHYSMDSAMDNPPLLRNSSRTRAGSECLVFLGSESGSESSSGSESDDSEESGSRSSMESLPGTETGKLETLLCFPFRVTTNLYWQTL